MGIEDSEKIDRGYSPIENDRERFTSAYKEALDSFNEGAIEAIQQSKGMEDLIQSLDRKRVDLNESSWFRKGLGILHGPLKRLDLLMPLGKAFAGLEPTASTAFGIVSAVIGVSKGFQLQRKLSGAK